MNFNESDLDGAINVFRHYLSNRHEKKDASMNSKVKELFAIASSVLCAEDKKTKIQKRKRQAELNHQKDKEKLKNTVLGKRHTMRSDVTNPKFDSEMVYKTIYTEDYSLPNAKARLHYEDKCYICLSKYRDLHQFYSRLCPKCAEYNWMKRQNSVDMTGKVCIVTGGRIKIGFCIALKLLRMGATVVVTSRFPNDTALRYSKENDFYAFKDRLHIYGLDFRDLNMVSNFCQEVKSKFKMLHVLINNAAQTVRKPPQFYQHLIENEIKPLDSSLLETVSVNTTDGKVVNSKALTGGKMLTKINKNVSALLSQVPFLPEDRIVDTSMFPPSKLDGDGQQLDLRPTNSWVSKLGSVSTIEMVECHLINTFAPWSLISELLPLIEHTPDEKFIVNVSAKEGQFYRNKTTDHPHTNMAKASLNMLTRTSAADLKNKQIYMTSVDTGWITDEHPHALKSQGWIQPIDEWDAAMRVLDPVLTGYQGGEKYHGVFLKDYHPSNW
ncbi:hypothetical protein HDV04_005462 [Boothiomyces sp. JEL0838]|nr:hypothetical protein HDV04_005445 [Boothiomyces sp. JEL0838]KAJ3310039.1 hypothetical protein HDV04_005462 [Boothiomyces sp. JEL0838]